MNIHVKKIRKDLGLTQSMFAERVGLSLRYIQNIEALDNVPRLETLFKIAKKLKISIHDLIDD